MKAVSFKGQNIVLGANQPEYEPLPALYLNNAEGTMITCWEFSDEEIQTMLKEKKIYVSQMTFNAPFQPIFISPELSDITEAQANFDSLTRCNKCRQVLSDNKCINKNCFYYGK